MKQFFEDYCNVKKIVCAKREYRRQMARVEALPPEYQYVFRKIQGQLWQFAAGPGYDMMQAHEELLDLFEEGAAAGFWRSPAGMWPPLWRNCFGSCGPGRRIGGGN